MSKDNLIRVLLVDDEQTFLKYLSKRLIYEGFEVRSTYSGEEALEVAANESFDVAVVDLNMPGMNGIEAQRKLKELIPDLQCIVLTGYSSIESALESGKQDAFRYFTKPIDYDTLMNAIKNAYQSKISYAQKETQESASEHDSRIKRAFRKLRRLYGVE